MLKALDRLHAEARAHQLDIALEAPAPGTWRLALIRTVAARRAGAAHYRRQVRLRDITGTLLHRAAEALRGELKASPPRHDHTTGSGKP